MADGRPVYTCVTCKKPVTRDGYLGILRHVARHRTTARRMLGQESR